MALVWGTMQARRRAPGRGFPVALPFAVLALVVLSHPTTLPAQVCGIPGKDGPGGVLSGVVNTYYPGLTASLSAGATSISIGTATGASVSITPGDLLLIVQMQDAAINSTNTSAYGANNGTGTGSTNINNSGRYEYVTATNSVGLGGGTVTIRGTGAGNGLVYAYTNAAASGTQGQRRYQVIRVPQYSSATFSSGLTAGYWNGTTGGILALDVAGTLTLGGTVSVDGRGFRGGSGRGLTGGGGGSNADYRNLASNNYHGTKGEGIAGTPRYVADQVTAAQIDNGVEGYPNGSTARGAPGNAGGGGTDGRPSANDENSGGGGGSNAGAGGRGGNSWNSNLTIGGLGGAAVAVAPARVILGGGGGAGSRNNSSGTASHGGAGGGIVLIRTGSVAGTGTITANGLAGNTPQNDGGGGGGAGGSVLVFAQTGGLGGLTVQARGGAGGNADVGGALHGPGGGGSGGYILLSSAAAADVSGGAAGYTVSPGTLYSATAGAAGSSSSTLTAGQIPGASPSAACVPALTVTKTTSTPAVVNSPTGTTATYTIVVANAAGRDTARTVTITDTLPAGFTFASSSTPVLSGGASRPSTTSPTAGSPVPTWSTFTIPGGGSVSQAFVVNVAATAPNGTYQNPARAFYLDPGRTAVNGTTSAAYAPGSSTAEDVTVSGTSMGTVTGSVFDDGNGDGVRQGGEPGIAGVTVVITDATAATQSVTTDANGNYSAVVPAGATTVTVTPPAGATLTTGNNPQTVSVPAGGSQAATAVGFRLPIDLSVSVLGAPDPVPFSANVTFTVTVTNLASGSGSATSVQLIDTLPAGVTFVSATPSQGTCSGTAVVTCALGSMANGGSATVTIVAKVMATGSLTNVARVTATQADPNLANNRATRTVTGIPAIVRDQFSAISYAGNNGNVNWTAPWLEVGETTSPTGGNIQVVSSGFCASGNCLLIGEDGRDINNRYVYRSADLSGATSAVLSFDYRRRQWGGNSGSVTLQVSGNGGVSWVSLRTFSFPGEDASQTALVCNISPYAASNTMIRFIGSGGNVESGVYLDNVQIEFSDQPPIGTGCTDGGPSQLAFVVEPSSTPVNQVIQPSIQVAVQDGWGRTVTSATNAVTLALGANPSFATLGGTTTANAVNGIATFANLSVDNIGTGFTLVATATGLTGATSTPFNITHICYSAPGGGPVFYQAFTEAWSATNVTSLDVPTTCGTSAGDLLIAVVSTNGDQSGSLAPPAGQGWQLLNRQSTGGFFPATQGVWWKIAGPGEPASHQFTWAGGEEAYGFMMRFTGHDPTTPIDASAFQTGADASPLSPSVTTTVDNTLVLRVGTFHGASVTVDQPGLPGHVPITMDFSSNDSFGFGAVSAGAGHFSPQTPQGPTGTAAFALTASQRWAAGTIAIRPGVSYGVSVTPDGTATFDRLPTNGTSYSFTFTIVNVSSVPQPFDLFAFLADGGASFLSVDSITGATVSRGAVPDSARLAALGVNDSANATVWYSAALVPVGAQDSLYLTARAVGSATATDSGWVHVRIIRPDLSVAKGVNPNGTQPPGTDLTYSITLTNIGTAEAVDVVNVDSLPPELRLKVGSVTETLPAGVTVTVAYSNDGGATWAYTPVSLGCGAPAGYDGCVNRIRWTLLTSLSATAPDNVATFQFVAQIR